MFLELLDLPAEILGGLFQFELEVFCLGDELLLVSVGVLPLFLFFLLQSLLQVGDLPVLKFA